MEGVDYSQGDFKLILIFKILTLIFEDLSVFLDSFSSNSFTFCFKIVQGGIKRFFQHFL